MKKSTQSIRKLKGERPVVALTAYDAIWGRLADEAEVDVILVGDSVGTTCLGYATTIPVTLDVMVHHSAAVARGVNEALLIADMPFGRAHLDDAEVVRAGMRLLQEGGAEGVKIEGGAERAGAVARCVQAGIPVMGHIGLQPQQFYALGGYRRFGKDAEAQKLLDDARALEVAGVFAIVAEMIRPELMPALCEAVGVPIIGIGCGHPADGQVLVCTDLLGLGHGKVPSFVKQYAQLNETVREAYRTYVREVRERTYPS